jgi:hypothetical protein
MRRDELLKPDLLGEIVLLGSSIVIFVPLLLMLVVALMGLPATR